MKAWKIFCGLGFILAAVLLILDAVGVIAPVTSIIGSVSAFEIILGLALVALIIERLIRGRLSDIFFLLAFLFMLFEENIAYVCHLEDENIINNWLLLLVASLLTAGFSILFHPKKRKKKHKRYAEGVTVEIDGKTAESKFSSSTIYVDCENFSPSIIENNLGSCSVYFKNVEKYEGAKTLYVENNLGSMTVSVPSDWIVKTSIDNNLGNIDVSTNEKTNECSPLLYIKGENNLGSLAINYV